MAFRGRRKRRKKFVNCEWGVSIASGHIVQLGGGGRRERRELGHLASAVRRALRVVSTCSYAFDNQ